MLMGATAVVPHYAPHALTLNRWLWATAQVRQPGAAAAVAPAAHQPARIRILLPDRTWRRQRRGLAQHQREARWQLLRVAGALSAVSSAMFVWRDTYMERTVLRYCVPSRSATRQEV